jgi:outer membrane protein OmpA-like peptidoglycan-associated protein
MGGPADTMPSRTMNTLTLSAMPGYKIGKFMPGILVDYRIVGQYTAVADVSNQNLRGSGLMFGLGTNYRVAERWMASLGVEFFGKHTLSQQTGAGASAEFKSPLGIKFGASYLVHPDYPATADLSFNYLKYKTLNTGGTDLDLADNGVSHWSIALGVTWHFGQPPIPPERDEDPLAALQAAIALEMQSEAENLFASTASAKTDPNLLARLKSDLLFNAGKAELLETANKEITRMGAMLNRYPKIPFRVEAYTDTTGSPAQNLKLTQARADAVRKALIRRGLSASHVGAKGYGGARPIGDNASEEGRTANRRIEIHVGR